MTRKDLHLIANSVRSLVQLHSWLEQTQMVLGICCTIIAFHIHMGFESRREWYAHDIIKEWMFLILLQFIMRPFEPKNTVVVQYLVWIVSNKGAKGLACIDNTGLYILTYMTERLLSPVTTDSDFQAAPVDVVGPPPNLVLPPHNVIILLHDVGPLLTSHCFLTRPFYFIMELFLFTMSLFFFLTLVLVSSIHVI